MAGVEEEIYELKIVLILRPNGKIGDNPLSDLTIHHVNRFPEEIKTL